MIKYIRKKLSVKIFLLTTLLLMGIAAAAYGFVAYVMPKTYTASLNKNLNAQAEELSKTLGNYTLEKARSLLDNFSEVYQSNLMLTNAQGEIVYIRRMAAPVSYEVTGTNGQTAEAVEQGDRDAFPEEAQTSEAVAEEVVTEDAIEQAVESQGQVYRIVEDKSGEALLYTPSQEASGEAEKKAIGHYPVTFKGNKGKYTLFVAGSTQQIRQAAAALKEVLPWLLLTIFAVSVLVSLFYSRYLTRPVVKLSRISRQMAALDFDIKTEVQREDEIGILGKSLDLLAIKLDSALTELQKANEKLQSDMELEREQERKRMEFFAAASHELKTPVTILKGQIEGMLQGVGDYKDRDRYLLRAREVTEALEHMVQEILTISRMEAAGFAVHKESTDLAELVRVQLAALNELFEKKKMHMEIFLPERLLWMADPALLSMAVQNLLVNAVRYSPEGERITVGLAREREGAVLRVENSGVWIPEEHLEKLFDAFYRVDSSRNRKNGGSGLGLYIVREILEQHRGEYCMENTAGGVQFTLRLPKEGSLEKITREPENSIQNTQN